MYLWVMGDGYGYVLGCSMLYPDSMICGTDSEKMPKMTIIFGGAPRKSTQKSETTTQKKRVKKKIR